MSSVEYTVWSNNNLFYLHTVLPPGNRLCFIMYNVWICCDHNAFTVMINTMKAIRIHSMNTVCPHSYHGIFHSDVKQSLHGVPLPGTTKVFYTICYIVWIYNVTIILSHWQYYESNIQQCPHPVVLFVNTVCYTIIVDRPTCYAVLSLVTLSCGLI